MFEGRDSKLNLALHSRAKFNLTYDQEGPPKLGTILAFATGASVIPPVGFSPQPSIDFLHGHPSSPKQRLPIAMANTCINCLKLPLLETYDDFKECMDFALGNTQGFGRE
ncbi:hypothetical protein KUCAC02_023881 [Chaenocephalus aceratus]|uniref:Uncharacterized protein n=1 Tax=Chaenocephalus aceratus TaxID=36190 RepID=A0ACB9WI11_CHAAC|nr:hypothetical protein KUCAC02_023881 [Chaenocephalus aceratus]